MENFAVESNGSPLDLSLPAALNPYPDHKDALNIYINYTFWV